VRDDLQEDRPFGGTRPVTVLARTRRPTIGGRRGVTDERSSCRRGRSVGFTAPPTNQQAGKVRARPRLGRKTVLEHDIWARFGTTEMMARARAARTIDVMATKHVRHWLLT